jgi:hypothetical protein
MGDCSHPDTRFIPDSNTGELMRAGREVCMVCKAWREIDGNHAGSWQGGHTPDEQAAFERSAHAMHDAELRDEELRAGRERLVDDADKRLDDL